jgi:site-specific DNA recombinase
MSKVRCAIYTRKSSEEGLEQDFNSLHAQREACAAYVLSQASEGWSLLQAEYDDGGLSGGTLERPALKRLLADIAAGKIDIVVVYKVDRLTRSLLDFAKLVEALDAAGTSFVSVTQSFNTTTSMGRLTLNMLLSFAQFEREVTAERIRDKIAASKAKGMWMGGNPPLGYRPEGRSLEIVPEHAELIRDLFRRYLELGNVRLLIGELERERTTVPARTTATGKPIGGGRFGRGQLYALLANPAYIGKIRHKDLVHDGLHEAIVDAELWDAVQNKLASNTNGAQQGPTEPSKSLLAGRVFDESGEPLVASHASKVLPSRAEGHIPGSAEGGRSRYRYYVSRSLQLGHKENARGLRIPAQEIEELVAEQVAALFDKPLELIANSHLEASPSRIEGLGLTCRNTAAQLRQRSGQALPQLITRVQLGQDAIGIDISNGELARHLDLPRGPEAPETLSLIVNAQLRRSGRIVRFVQHGGKQIGNREPLPHLVRLMQLSHRWWQEMLEEHLSATQMASRHGVDKSYVSRVIRLRFLSPRIVEQVVAGEQSAELDARTLLGHKSLPLSWNDQERMLLAR